MLHAKSEGCRGTAEREGGAWTVAYTNVDGLVSVMDEVNEFIRANEPDIMAMVETKLRDSETPNLGGGKYNMWIRNRCGKGGGGVMMLVKKGIRVESVEKAEGLVEGLNLQLINGRRGLRYVTVVYVPPKTKTWNRQEHEQLLSETKEWLVKKIKENNKIVIMGDFNCKEINWEEWNTRGGEDSWGDKVLKLAMNNIMTQWVEENTRYRGGEEPSRLNLVLSKETDIIEDMNYSCPLGKSDHVIIRFCIKEKREESRCEDYKSQRFNYGKSNFEQMRRYFSEADWSTFITESNVQKKWEAFINIYEEEVKRYVPKVETKRRYNNDWYDRRCEIAREEREMAWNR